MSKIRLAIGGASMRGDDLARMLCNTGQVEIVAIADPIVAQARHLKDEHGLADCEVFASIEEALGNVDCDAVMVAASDAHHAEVVVPALEAGKFVFCEKPLETTLEKCRSIIEADRKAGYKTFVGLNLRYAPTYTAIKQQIDQGAIGRVLTIQADEFYDGGRTYFRRWNRLRSEGGGLWITKATHDFDLITYLAGGATPLEIFATVAQTYYVPKADAAMQCRNCKLEPECSDKAWWQPPLASLREAGGGEPYDLCLYNAESDTFDHGIATIRYEKDILATYTCNVVCGFSDRRIRVSGTKGTLDGSMKGQTVVLHRRDPSECVEIAVDGVTDTHGGADEELARGFIDFVRGQAPPRCRPEEATVSVRMGLAATRASDEHRNVPLSEFEL